MVTLSNGTTQTASTAAWATDNAGVLSINDSSGVAAGVAHGSATITATAQGVTATRTIRVVQDYQGTWLGTYRIRVCTASGIFRDIWCTDDTARGAVNPVRLSLTQDGSSASGTLELGEISGTIRGAIFDSRRFVGAMNTSLTSEGVQVNINIGTFDVLSSGNQLTGSFVASTTVPGFTGTGYFEGDIVTVTRVSAPSISTLVRRPFASLSGLEQGFGAILD